MFLIGQVNECLSPPEDLHSYECGDREVVKLYRSKHDKMTGAFLGLYGTLGYIMVSGDPQEHFLDYGFCKKIQRFSILTTKSVNRVVFRVPFSIVIESSMNPGHFKA